MTYSWVLKQSSLKVIKLHCKWIIRLLLWSKSQILSLRLFIFLQLLAGGSLVGLMFQLFCAPSVSSIFLCRRRMRRLCWMLEPCRSTWRRASTSLRVFAGSCGSWALVKVTPTRSCNKPGYRRPSSPCSCLRRTWPTGRSSPAGPWKERLSSTPQKWGSRDACALMFVVVVIVLMDPPWFCRSLLFLSRRTIKRKFKSWAARCRWKRSGFERKEWNESGWRRS